MHLRCAFDMNTARSYAEPCAGQACSSKAELWIGLLISTMATRDPFHTATEKTPQ